MLNRSLVLFCIYGGLELPALVIAHIVIYRKFLRTINLFTKLEQNKVFVLAALEPICSCALLPFCYLIFKGHGMRSASSQVNSKRSKFHPVGVCINLPLPRLSIICG
nr:MAG TPA: hypothetical protein [Caudoviricetes sp.]